MGEQPLVLREMTIADIIDSAIRIYRHNFAPILGIGAIVQIPMVALQIVAADYLFRMAYQAQGKDFPVEQFAVAFGWFLGALLVAALILPLGEAALAIAVSERYLGRPITVSGAYRRALPYWGRVLWTSILFGLWAYLWLLIGLICLILPGFVLLIGVAVRYLFAPAVIVVLENRWGRESMRRSWQLTQGYSLIVFATMAILVLMVLVATYGVTAPLQLGMIAFMKDPQKLLMGMRVYQSVAATVTVVLRPLTMIGSVLIYYDLRIRKEGLDLMMMAEALGMPAPGKAEAAEEALLYPQEAAPAEETPWLFGAEAPAKPAEAPPETPEPGTGLRKST